MKNQSCTKCGWDSGNDWSQCSGSCPMPMSPHYKKEETMKVWPGKVVMVFDNKLWKQNGGDSANDTFMRPATILEVYSRYTSTPITAKAEVKDFKYPELLANVRFHHDERESHGHFVDSMQEYEDDLEDIIHDLIRELINGARNNEKEQYTHARKELKRLKMENPVAKEMITSAFKGLK